MAQWCPQRTRGYTFSMRTMRTFDMGKNIIHTSVSKSWWPTFWKYNKTLFGTLFVENFGIVFRNIINGNMIWNNILHHGWVNLFHPSPTWIGQNMLMSFSLTTHYLHHCGGQKRSLRFVDSTTWVLNIFNWMGCVCVCVSTGWDWNLSTSDNIHQITCWYYKW